MITGYYESNGTIIATTQGCGCCSTELDVNKENRREIAKELIYNVNVLKESCQYLGFSSIEELIKYVTYINE